jgi:FMN phosphatase YigB (HAD superfamily)
MIRAVVTDLDNTLYSWVDYIVPSLEAMVASLCASSGLPRIRVVQSLKRVYEQYGSNEYPFVIQEADVFAELTHDFGSFNQLVIEPAQLAFKQARKKYLRLYPGVLETLTTLRERGVRVCALTDAPRNPAELRVKLLGLDQGLLERVYTLPAFPLPARVDPRIVAREKSGAYRAKVELCELPAEYEKPDPRGLARVIADLGLTPAEVLYVGDSRLKDVALAQAQGCVDAHAEYGTYRSVEYAERLEAISAPSATRRHLAQDGAAPIAPTHRLAAFDQLLGILEASASASARRAS